MHRNGNQDILSIIFKSIDTAELIRWYYDPPTGVCVKKVSEELKKRVITLDVDNLEENKEALFEIYAQSQKGRAISDFAAGRISEMVRIKVQRQMEDTCRRQNEDRYGFCDLTNTRIISNKLLESLAHFDKSIIVPSAVENLYLSGLGLTSLWLKFGYYSQISKLYLVNHKFEELNYRTFGQYIGGRAGRQLRYLYLRSIGIAEIDFDALGIPNIEDFSAVGCASLSKIESIPRVMSRIYLEHTDIKRAAQFQFKHQTANNLEMVTFHDDVDCDEIEQLLKSVCVCQNWGTRENRLGGKTMHRT